MEVKLAKAMFAYSDQLLPMILGIAVKYGAIFQ